MEKPKRRWGDRKDGRLIRELDPMHFIVPLIYPNRCDNEAYISERIDLTNINAYLARRNATETDFPFTMFHIIVVALLKTITLRPKMNRFIANNAHAGHSCGYRVTIYEGGLFQPRGCIFGSGRGGKEH